MLKLGGWLCFELPAKLTNDFLMSHTHIKIIVGALLLNYDWFKNIDHAINQKHNIFTISKAVSPKLQNQVQYFPETVFPKLSLLLHHNCQYTYRCVKSFCIRRFSGPYFPAFGLNMERQGVEKDGPEKLRIRTLFTQCIVFRSPFIGSKQNTPNKVLSNSMVISLHFRSSLSPDRCYLIMIYGSMYNLRLQNNPYVFLSIQQTPIVTSNLPHPPNS